MSDVAILDAQAMEELSDSLAKTGSSRRLNADDIDFCIQNKQEIKNLLSRYSSKAVGDSLREKGYISVGYNGFRTILMKLGLIKKIPKKTDAKEETEAEAV